MINDLTHFDDALEKYIKKNRGLGFLFRKIRCRVPFIGESLILSHILHLSIELDKPYSRDSLNYTLRTYVKEDLSPETKQWLRSLCKKEEV